MEEKAVPAAAGIPEESKPIYMVENAWVVKQVYAYGAYTQGTFKTVEDAQQYIELVTERDALQAKINMMNRNDPNDIGEAW